MFDDFHNDKEYLARSVDFFERKVGIRLRDARSFGGFGNMAADPRVRRGRLLLAGEAAGLQDALFGFGMRYALTSGYLAGQAWVDQDLSGVRGGISMPDPSMDSRGGRQPLPVPALRCAGVSDRR